MLVYAKNRKSKYHEVPVWKADWCMRLRGWIDGVMHKTDFRTRGDKNTLSGGYYERVRRELATLEAAQIAWLNKSLGPKVVELKAMPRVADGSDRIPRTTSESRAAREAAVRRAAAQKKRRELTAFISSELLTAESEINTAYCTANAALTRYGKASKFSVLDEEIPHFTAKFSAKEFAKHFGIEEVVA